VVTSTWGQPPVIDDEDAFGVAAPASDALELVRPPSGLLWGAGACVGVSAALLLLAHRWAQVVGYLVGCVTVVALIGAYLFIDRRRSSDPRYSAARRSGVAINLLFFGGVIVASIHVWRLATELAK